MPKEVQDIPIPPSSKSKIEADKELYERHQKGKQLREEYESLKRNLETIYELKTASPDSLKDQRAINYFETCQAQIKSKLEQHEESLKKLLEQMNSAKKTLEEKLLFVNQRLDAARQRSVAQTKTKEEIKTLKSIEALIKEYSKLLPRDNLEICFPDYRKLLNLPEKQIPPPPPEETAPPPPPQPLKPSYTKAKRVPKPAPNPEPNVEEVQQVPQESTEPEPSYNNMKLITNSKR